MRIVVRSDGMILNLNAVLIFTPCKGDMIVELPGNQHYIIRNFETYDLRTNKNEFDKEWEGWPKQ